LTKEEAMEFALKSGAEDVDAAAEYFVKTFPKEITEYTKEDFLDGTEPFEYIYLFKDDNFTQSRLINKVAQQSKAVGAGDFRKLYKAFLTTKTAVSANGSVTDFPEQPLVLRCGNWLCDERGVRTMTTDRGMMCACPHPIMPVEYLENIDTGEHKVKLAYFKGYWKTAIFDRKTLSSASKITEISSAGISVTSETARCLVNYLYDMEQFNGGIIPETECVTHLGWIERGKRLEFVPYTKNVQFDGEADYRDRFYSVRAEGDFEKWTDFIDKEIRHNPYPLARIVFASSLASPLIKLLNANCFWIHLWGKTGSAKTVLMMCAASIWGNPERGKFVSSFNSTYVGNEKGAAFSGSMPYMIDELQILDRKRDMDSLIYMLTEGCGRARGNKRGGLDVIPKWKNAVISTGEHPVNNAHSNGGAVGRVIEVECKNNFFGSGEHAREVLNFILENHGFFGRVFYLKLRETPHGELEEIYKRHYREIESRGFMDKQTQTAAVILTADELACKWLFGKETQLTADEIAPFLKTDDEVSADARGYDYLCQQIAANQLHFVGSDRPIEIWGELSGDSVYIIKSQFDRLCTDGGFAPAPLLSWLSERRLIERRDKHMTVPKSIGGVLTRCVHMSLNSGNIPCENCTDDYPDF